MWRVGIRPTCVTYNVIINSYAVAAERAITAHKETRFDVVRKKISQGKVERRVSGSDVLEKAFAVLDHMRQAGVPPDVWTYNTLLNACAKSAAAGRRAPRKGVRVLELMRDAGLTASKDQYALLLQACKHADSGQADAYALGLRVRELMFSTVGLEWSQNDEHAGNVVGTHVVDAGATWHASKALRYANVRTEDGMIDASSTGRCRSPLSLALLHALLCTRSWRMYMCGLYKRKYNSVRVCDMILRMLII
jgi:hypothetical protein